VFQVRILHCAQQAVFLCFRLTPPDNLLYGVTERSQIPYPKCFSSLPGTKCVM